MADFAYQVTGFAYQGDGQFAYQGDSGGGVPAVEGFKMDWGVGQRRKAGEEPRKIKRDDEDAIAAILISELSNYDNSKR